MPEETQPLDNNFDALAERYLQNYKEKKYAIMPNAATIDWLYEELEKHGKDHVIELIEILYDSFNEPF